MRTAPVTLLNAVAITNADVFGPTQSLNQVWGYACQASWTTSGTLVGTIYLQASNDGTTWSQILGTSFAVNGGGSTLWNVATACYLYFRVFFSYSSGNGTLNANVVLKGY